MAMRNQARVKAFFKQTYPELKIRGSIVALESEERKTPFGIEVRKEYSVQDSNGVFHTFVLRFQKTSRFGNLEFLSIGEF